MTAIVPAARPTHPQPLQAGEQNCKHSKAVPLLGGVRGGFIGIAAFVLVALNTGCISTEKTEYRDTERIKVEFENDTAGRQFYEALSKLESRHHRSESKTELSIPVVFDHKHRIVEGDNVVFNDAVRRCDTNGDGKITELEARIFAEAASKHL